MEDQEYAGFWIRVAAALIDTVFLIILCAIPLTLIYGASYWTEQIMVRGFWDIVIQYVLPAIVTVWFWVKFMGTPGKMVLRLRVVDARTGQAISTSQGVRRYLGYYLSILPLMLGIIWVGIDKRKQGFHDKFAGTVVVRQIGKEPVKFDG